MCGTPSRSDTQGGVTAVIYRIKAYNDSQTIIGSTQKSAWKYIEKLEPVLQKLGIDVAE